MNYGKTVNYGRVIKFLREASGISIKHFSKISGYESKYLEAIEKGEVEITISFALILSEQMGIDIKFSEFEIIAGYLSTTIDDIPKSRKEMYKELDPVIKAIIKEIIKGD